MTSRTWRPTSRSTRNYRGDGEEATEPGTRAHRLAAQLASSAASTASIRSSRLRSSTFLRAIAARRPCRCTPATADRARSTARPAPPRTRRDTPPRHAAVPCRLSNIPPKHRSQSCSQATIEGYAGRTAPLSIDSDPHSDVQHQRAPSVAYEALRGIGLRMALGPIVRDTWHHGSASATRTNRRGHRRHRFGSALRARFRRCGAVPRRARQSFHAARDPRAADA